MRPSFTRWKPKNLHASAALLQPILDLAAGLLQERRLTAPNWSDSIVSASLPLLQVDRWLQDVSATLRDPTLGLMSLAGTARGTGQMAELAAECAPTLGAALTTLARHSGTVDEAASLHLHEQGETAVFVMRSRLRRSHILRDYGWGLVALTVARWLGSSAGLRLWFAGPPPSYAPSYRRALADIEVGFDAPLDALVLPAESLSFAMPRADARLHDFMRRLAARVERFERGGGADYWECVD